MAGKERHAWKAIYRQRVKLSRSRDIPDIEARAIGGLVGLTGLRTRHRSPFAGSGQLDMNALRLAQEEATSRRRNVWPSQMRWPRVFFSAFCSCSAGGLSRNPRSLIGRRMLRGEWHWACARLTSARLWKVREAMLAQKSSSDPFPSGGRRR